MAGRPVILAVDDDEKILKLLSVNLITEGYQVITATSGKQALEMMHGNPPALVFLDINMPGMNGFETLRRIREESEVPVIMLTAIDDSTSLMTALRAGADDYITKPFSVKELLARVHAKLRRHSPPDN